MLGGIELPWDMGLQGHSDADVICHALIDALCGAAGIGDIGTLFPDDDPKYKDARSLDLLREVADHCRRAKWAVENVDVTLLAQVPRLAPYREAGIARVLLEVPDASRDEVLRRLDKSAPLAADNR